MRPFQNIVVAIDFSETTADTIDEALDIARGQQQRLHLLHVVPDALHMLGVTEAPGVDWAAVQQNLVQEARLRLAGVAAARTLDPRRVTLTVEAGDVVSEILRYAGEHQTGVIVLGSHGHGIIRRFVLGSVAERVLRQATCAVMLVPHRQLRLTSFEVKAASGVES